MIVCLANTKCQHSDFTFVVSKWMAGSASDSKSKQGMSKTTTSKYIFIFFKVDKFFILINIYIFKLIDSFIPTAK